MEITIRDNHFQLHPTGAMFWVEKNAVLISDVHIGKIAHFRKHGSAVPHNAILKNFEMLDAVIEMYAPKHIYFLGDLFHSNMNTEYDYFKEWVETLHGIKLALVIGNHDIIDPAWFEVLGMDVMDEKIIDGFLFTHIPSIHEKYYNLCGHIHPGVVLSGAGRQTLKVPCFYQNETQLLLPAFGTFTGLFPLKPEKNTVIYALAKTEVIKVETSI